MVYIGMRESVIAAEIGIALVGQSRIRTLTYSTLPS